MPHFRLIDLFIFFFEGSIGDFWRVSEVIDGSNVEGCELNFTKLKALLISAIFGFLSLRGGFAPIS